MPVAPQSRLAQRLSWALIAVIGIAALGTSVRLAAYLENRSIWSDEAALAQSIVTRSFGGLVQPLDRDQGAPLGYMALVKTFLEVGGHNEYALRATSMLSAVGSLLAFAAVTWRYFSVTERIVACALFALCPVFVMYGGEAKQYSFDVFVTTVLLYLALWVDEADTTLRLAMLGAVGALAIWFSHPAVFVLATIGTLLFVKAVRVRKPRETLSILAIGVVWLVSFGALYILNLRQLTQNELLQVWWRERFIPLSFVEGTKWMWNTYWLLFLEPFGPGEATGYLLGWLFIVGFIWLCANKRDLAWLVSGPLLFALLASAFRFYPFGGAGGRLLAFALPAVILGSATGWRVVAANRSWIVSCALVMTIFPPLLKLTVRQARGDTTGVRQAQELRPLLQRMQKEARAGDHVYVFDGATPAFWFYAKDFGYLAEHGLQVTNGLVGFHRNSVDASDYERDLSRLKGKGRVWLVYSNAYWRTLNDEEMIVSAARKLGAEREILQAPGASVRLFDFDQ